MTVIKICDHFLKTNLSKYDSSELIKSRIIDEVVENGQDFLFSLDDFIEELVESNEKFETMEDSHDWDIEFTPEQVDEIVEEAFSGEEEEELDDDLASDFDEDLDDGADGTDNDIE